MTRVPRRDWSDVTVRREAGGFVVLLDERRLNTPARVPVALPSMALAERVAEEWRAVEDRIDPRDLPLTGMANTAIDRIPAVFEAIVGAISEYGDADLLCYRAASPSALALRQAEAWDPWLTWARETLAAPLLVIDDLAHQPQPPESLARLRAAVSRHGAFEIAALQDLVALSGSLVLGLAISRGALAGEEAWTLSRLDEAWQTEQWGVDAEAAMAAARTRSEFLRADAFLRLARAGDA